MALTGARPGRTNSSHGFWSAETGARFCCPFQVCGFGKAAGVGSSIETIRSFTWHASEKQNFKPSYVPWYITRPLQGMLLGLIFFWLLKGGLLALQVADAGDKGRMNEFSLAGIGALVGLFSRRAIDKLSKLFLTMFRTENEMRRQLAMLTGETRDKLLTLLPDKIRKTMLFGTTDEVRQALRSLTVLEKKELLDKLPSLVKPLFADDLKFEDGDVVLAQIAALKQTERVKLLQCLGFAASAIIAEGKGTPLITWLGKLTETEKTKLRDKTDEELPLAAKTLLAPF